VVANKKCSGGSLVYTSPRPIQIPGVARFRLVQDHTENEVVSVITDPQQPVLDVTAGMSSILVLSFGESEDPTHVPVKVLAFHFRLPSFKIVGVETGENHSFLDPEFEGNLVYNQTTGEMRSGPLHTLTVNRIFRRSNPMDSTATVEGTLNRVSGELFVMFHDMAHIPGIEPPPTRPGGNAGVPGPAEAR